MSSNVEKLLGQVAKFEKIATETLDKTAEKLDPKAKVRNRGNVCVPAESAKDKKDHFPINNEAQARNALARVNQFSKVPEWYSGSLQGLVSLVARKVKAKYPGIEVSKDAKKPGKKKASEYYDPLLNKYGQGFRDRLKNLNPFGKTKATPPPPGGYGLVQPPAPAEDTSGPTSPPKAMDAPAEREQQAPAFVKEVFDPRTNKWYPSKDDAELSALPEGTRARYHSGDEYVYFTKTKTGWDEEGAKSPAPAASGKPAGHASSIPFRADVRAAQIQFNKLNKQNGNLVPPLAEDGKLGDKSKAAFRGFNLKSDIETNIKDLSEQGMTWNVKPELPPLPAPGKLELDKSDPWAKPSTPTSTTASLADKFLKKLS